MILRRRKRPSTPAPRLGAPLLIGLAILALWSGPTRADFSIAIDNIQGPVNGVGSFEVLLTNPAGAAQAQDAAGISIQLSAGSGLHFTGVSTATAAVPYIFEGTGGATIDPGFQFSFDAFPDTQFTASDSEFTFAGITVNAGDVFGLALVTYSVDAGASGDIPIEFQAGTSLSDPGGAPIGFTATGGVVQVRSVPEPSTLLLTGLGLGAVGWARMRSARTRSR
ncbi:MAG: hypothetical protein JWN86_180 [Planctomycetota bacterium]|nr:hypothetical protein [Planctomycetota bacterium]